MGKQKKKKRIIREDLVQNRLPRLFKGNRHSAYSWMKRCKEGQLPPGNTNVAKTLAAIEVELIQHFGKLNGPQQVQLNLLRPLLVFWLLHPGTTKEGTLACDYKWTHQKIEAGLKVLCELGSNDKVKEPDLSEYLKETYGNKSDDSGHTER